MKLNCIFKQDDTHYKVLSVFKKRYGKWWHKSNANSGEKYKTYLLEMKVFCTSYTDIDLMNLGEYMANWITKK